MVTTSKIRGRMIAYAQYHANRRRILLRVTDEFMYRLKKKDIRDDEIEQSLNKKYMLNYIIINMVVSFFCKLPLRSKKIKRIVTTNNISNNIDKQYLLGLNKTSLQ